MPTWIPILQALLTPVIAFAVGVVGFLQWRTAHQKVILDLFDRRITIYRSMRSVIDDAVLNYTPVDKELLVRIHQVTQEASFLFGEDVNLQMHSLKIVLMQIEVFALMEMGAKTLRSDFVKTIDEVRDVAELRARAVVLLENISLGMKPYMRMDQKQIRTPSQWFQDRNELRKSYGDQYQR